MLPGRVEFDLSRLTPRAARLLQAKLDSSPNKALADAVRDALRNHYVNFWLPKLAIEDARAAVKFFCSVANEFNERRNLSLFGKRHLDLAMLFCLAIAVGLDSQMCPVESREGAAGSNANGHK